MLLTVNVTHEDIDTARALDRMPSCWCPVALAAKRATRCAVWVEGTYIQVGNVDTPEPLDEWAYTPLRTYPRYNLPQEARDFITLYDEGFQVVPFSFTLNLADEETQPA